MNCNACKYCFAFDPHFILQEDEVIPSIYAGLSEDDRFIGKLLAAQNTMVNIQTEFTRLIQDYIVIKKKDQKRRGKNRSSFICAEKLMKCGSIG